MTEIKNLTVRPSPKLRAKLEEIAESEGVSIARVVTQLIEEGLVAREGGSQAQINADVQKELAEIKARLDRLEK